MKNSFCSGENIEGKVEINGIDDVRDNLRVSVDARVIGWLKIKFTDNEEHQPSMFPKSLFSSSKGKTIEYKNNRRIYRYLYFFYQSHVYVI